LYRAAEAAARSVYYQRLERRLREGISSYQRIEQEVREREVAAGHSGRLVVLVNVSSRTRSITFNAAVHVLLGWALRLAGRPVRYFTCRAGLPKCVAGTVSRDPLAPPPCERCERLTDALLPAEFCRAWGRWPEGYDEDLVRWLSELEERPLDELRATTFEGLPVGQMAWTSLMWSLRLGDLSKDAAAAWALARLIVGGAQLARRFQAMLEAERPAAVVAFNGLFFPEAVAAAVARRSGVRVVTYETGFRPGSIHFSHGEATQYDVRVPEDFELSEAQERELDEHLRRRFRGDFTMAGVRFWPEMKETDERLFRTAKRFRHVVPVFTNVVFDTSQAYSNTCFRDMFDWLDATVSIARETPDTCFVVRAHPDESRSGKESREPVGRWLKESGALDLANVAFVGPGNYLSSYRLIREAACVLLYNSSIGLEAAMLGKPTVSGGRARYHSAGAVRFPETPEAYRREVRSLLEAEEVPLDPDARQAARRYYYYVLWKACIDLSCFLGTSNQVSKLPFADAEKLRPELSEEIRIILRGILEGDPFRYP
jgi:hypothetical protein